MAAAWKQNTLMFKCGFNNYYWTLENEFKSYSIEYMQVMIDCKTATAQVGRWCSFDNDLTELGAHRSQTAGSCQLTQPTFPMSGSLDQLSTTTQCRFAFTFYICTSSTLSWDLLFYHDVGSQTSAWSFGGLNLPSECYPRPCTASSKCWWPWLHVCSKRESGNVEIKLIDSSNLIEISFQRLHWTHVEIVRNPGSGASTRTTSNRLGTIAPSWLPSIHLRLGAPHPRWT